MEVDEGEPEEQVAREYQVELFRYAMDRNTIVCLKTGSGKTFISVLLIKELQHQVLIPYNDNGKRTCFLVPKVTLVFQQAEVISRHTQLKVGQYYGSRKMTVGDNSYIVDDWSKEIWKRELEENNVLVMTAQILLNLLESGFITMDRINLIVMDECHKAVKNDPYCQIMKCYERQEKADPKLVPKILGLTASVLQNKTNPQQLPKILGLTASVLHGRCKPMDISKNIENLQVCLRSRIVTAENVEIVNKYSTKAREVCVAYKNNDTSAALEDVCGKIERVLRECEKEIDEIEAKLSNKEVIPTAAILTKIEEGRLISVIRDRERILNEAKLEELDELYATGINLKCSPKHLLKNVKAVYESLGLWATGEIVACFLEDIPRFRKDAINLDQGEKKQIFDILQQHLSVIKQIIDDRFRTMADGDAILEGSSSKLIRLLDVLKPFAFSENFRGIILVEQRAIAWMLSHTITKLKEHFPEIYQKFNSCYIVGHGLSLAYSYRSGMSVEDQATSLQFFKRGVSNLLVGTSVIEEGVDVPECNVVIRYDMPKTFCSYVQSKGRARAENALFILLHPSTDKNDVKKSLTYYRVLEQELIKISRKNKLNPDEEGIEGNIRGELDNMYFVKTKLEAFINLDCAIMILDRYCNSLPHDRFTSVRPKYMYIKNEEDLSQVCSAVILPMSTSLLDRTIHGGLWNDKKTAKKIAAFEACKRLFEAGELNDYLMPAINFIDRYKHDLGIAVLKSNGLKPSKAGTKRRQLPYPKQIAEEFTHCFPSPNSTVYLYPIRFSPQDASNNTKGPHFGILTAKPISKVLPFNLYGKFSCVVSIQAPIKVTDLKNIDELKAFHEFLFDDVCRITNSLLTFAPEQTNSILVVPLIENSIDFDLIKSCVEFKNSNNAKEQQPFQIPKVGDVVQPTYGPIESRSRRFYVNSIISTRGNDDVFKYFETRYNIKVTRHQPVLNVNYVPNSLNLLHPDIAFAISKTQEEKRKHMFQIPEFCKKFPLDINHYREAYCLPSVLHRINGLLLVNRLRLSLMNEAAVMPTNLESPYVLLAHTLENLSNDIEVKDDVIFCNNLVEKNRLQPNVLYAVLFQAITTNSAANWDCLERLELIGDSFLKIVVSICLYCRFPQLHEGGLTNLRTGMIRNFNLVKHAKYLPNILNASSFLPKQMWIPPGFKIHDKLTHELIKFSVPYHLWPHAKLGDLNELIKDDEKWIDTLKERYANIDKTRRLTPEKKLRTYVRDADDINDCDSSSNELEELTFDKYSKQLIGDKTIADSVEAIIGAVLVSCGRDAALRTIEWFGIKIFTPANPENVPTIADEEESFPWTVPSEQLGKWNYKFNELFMDLEILEAKIGYTFQNKGLLIQAVVHPTYERVIVEHYQKLEFLGDAILDYLVTMHLYQNWPKLSPGNMTDLRSSLVDNCTFAYLAVENDMHKALRYNSSLLFNVINKYCEYRKYLAHPKDTIYFTKESDAYTMEEIEVPKALGDIFESIAGAIFLDSGLSLRRVWDVYYPMLKDVIEKYSKALPINPIRHLYEKYPDAKFSKVESTAKGYASMQVKLQERVFTGVSKDRKIAKIAAAKCALRFLNIQAVRNVTKDFSK